MSPLPISASMQDYLEGILNLSCQQEAVRVTDIAERLKLTKPSVAQALKQLRLLGLIKQSHYGPVQLTEKGQQYALIVRRRHQVLRSFLVEVLGLDHQAAEKDACQMEHAVSSETIEKLIGFLVKGKYCTDDFNSTKRDETGR